MHERRSALVRVSRRRLNQNERKATAVRHCVRYLSNDSVIDFQATIAVIPLKTVVSGTINTEACTPTLHER